MAIITEVVRVIRHDVFDLVVGFNGGDKYLNSKVTSMIDLNDKSGTTFVRVVFENDIRVDIYVFDEFITCPVDIDYKEVYSNELEKQIKDTFEACESTKTMGAADGQ